MNQKKWKFVGFNTNRLEMKDEYGQIWHIPEHYLVDEFNNQFKSKHTLNKIINHPRGYLTNNEIKVAMSMLQWLGTNVGSEFYETAMKKASDKTQKLDFIYRIINPIKNKAKCDKKPISIHNDIYNFYYYTNGTNNTLTLYGSNAENN